MKRPALAAVLLLGLGLAGGLSSSVLAETTNPTETTGVTTTTPAPTTTAATTTAPTTTARPKPPAPEPKPVRLPQRVRIAGIAVGGLHPDAAYALVRTSFDEPLPLVVQRTRFAPTPSQLGAVAYARAAVNAAKRARPGATVPLTVLVRSQKLDDYLAKLAKRYDRQTINAQLTLRNLRPYITPDATGQALDRAHARKAIIAALRAYKRGPVRLRVRPMPPSTTRDNFGPIVVIRRESKGLYLYDGMRLVRRFGVATGRETNPTPLGRFEIIVKWANPWWYPPDSDWAEGLKPVPPGPGNPLGTRWMGISSPAIGIHGTPDAASIGYSASRGCIRMRVPEAEWLFKRVEIGSPVFIVRA